MPNRFQMMRGANGQEFPIIPELLSPEFMQQNQQNLVSDPNQMMSVDPQVQQMQNIPTMEARTSEEIRKSELSRRVQEEKDRIRKRRKGGQFDVPTTDENLERIATERVSRQLDREAKAEQAAEAPSRARYNDIIATNEERASLGLDPLPIPEDLQKFAGVSRETMDRQDPARAEDFVGGANMQRQMSPQEMRMMQMQGLLGRPSQLLDEGIRQFASGAITQSEAEARGADRLAQLADRTARDLEASQKENDLRRRQSLERLEQQSQKYEDLTNKLADFQFDPTGGFSSKSGLNKALTAIAIGVGGAADAFLGQPNQTLQIVENAIKRDIDAQKMRFSALQGRAEAQKSLFGQMMDIFGSEEAASAATEAALLKSMAFRTEAIKNKTQSEAVGGALTMQIGEYLRLASAQEANLAQLGLQAIQDSQKPNLAPETTKQLQRVQFARGLLDNMERDFQELDAATGALGRIPGTAAKKFNASQLRRLAQIQGTLLLDVPRAEKLRSQLLAKEGTSATTFRQTFENVMESLRRDITSLEESVLNVGGLAGEDVGVFGPTAQDFDFEER